MLHLTDFSIRSLAPPAKGQKDYFDKGLAGFGLRVSQGGTRSFFVFLGKASSRERHSIGRYGIISLAEARTEAKRLLAEQTLGHIKPKSILFSEAQTKFEELHFPSLKERTRKDYKRVLDVRLAKLHSYKLTDITFEDVTKITDKLVKTPREQFHTLVVAGTFFKWCVRRRYIKHNPIEGVDIPKLPTRKRVLKDDELAKVYQAADKFYEPFRSIVLLLILLGQRRGETSALFKTWVSHNEQTLTLAAEITKNGREHVVPLQPMALAVIGTTTPDGHYFPSGKTDGKPFSGFSKCKRQLDAMLDGVDPWTLHDLRRTFSTNLAKLGVAPHIKEALLNHISAKSEVEAIYDRYTYLPEMRDALGVWEAHLTKLLIQHPA
jgi:integrase